MTTREEALIHQPVSDSGAAMDLAPSGLTQGSANEGPQRYALGMAKVLRVDYAKHEITLLIQTGETFKQVPIPLTYPSAGSRHFMGSVPMCGDICVIGWGSQESGSTRKPFIINWMIPGVTAGYDWMPTQPFTAEELGFSPKEKAALEGVADRVRHKFRPLEPGNTYAASAQGSEMLLDESVLITNRRANEIRLRDADQAIVMRSLQQFHALAGARMYGGMVQRDATLLPTQMFSDGIFWDAPRQVDVEGAAVSAEHLGTSPYDEAVLTPSSVFQRDDSGNPIAKTADGDYLQFPADVDPYDFLRRGLFIDATGQARGTIASEAIYGGKPFFRVSKSDPSKNSATAATEPTLTELRWEVAHVADGTLPVTEQTDNFDANRLSSTEPREKAPASTSIDAPFIEWVMGSVVGNDAFSFTGRSQYGLPLRPVVFDGDERSPALVSGIGAEMQTHAASLFRMKPPIGVMSSKPTWWSTTKDGRVFGYVGGPGNDWSTEFAFGTGVRIGGGATPEQLSLRLDMDGGIIFRAQSGDNQANVGVLITSDKGAVKIFGGGSTTEGGAAARQAPTGDGDGGLPSVVVEAATNMLIKAAKTLTLQANALDLKNVAALLFQAGTSFTVTSGDGISHSSKTNDTTVMGKATENYSGPTNSLPTNLPLRSTQFLGNPATGVPGGTVDSYSVLMGDRSETFTAGNHRTQIAIGLRTYTVLSGAHITNVGPNNQTISPAGYQVTAATGVVALTAAAGAMSLSASAGISIAAAGPMSLAAAALAFTVTPPLNLPPGGVPGGFVLTDGCYNPLTGLPFKASGVFGVPGMLVT